MSESKQKLVFLAKHGPEHPEKATLPFAMALGAMATDIEAMVILQSDGVSLAREGVAEHVFAPGMTGFKELMDLFITDGGRVLACTACISARKITQDQIVDKVELASVARLAKEFSEAANVISY